MRKLAVLVLLMGAVALPATAKGIRTGGGPVEADWDPRIQPGDPGIMTLHEFLAAGYGPMKIRRPGVGNGGRDEDYVNGHQVR